MPHVIEMGMELSYDRRRPVYFALILLTIILFWKFFPVHTTAVSKKAYELFSVLKFLPITNAMVTTWVISLLIILAVRKMVGRPALVPGTKQSIIEVMIEGLRGLLEPIVGRRVFPKVFPLLLAFFLFILIQNWSGLLPGVGAFGLRKSDGHFFYFFRPANSDLNGTLALALISFGAWLYFVLRYAGLRHFLHHTFGNRADRASLSKTLYVALGFIFLGVGLIDLISMLFRVVSLSFRLYGNVFGGENLISSMLGLAAYLVPVPFYFLELLIGLIQALVFTLLTAVYIGLLTNDEE